MDFRGLSRRQSGLGNQGLSLHSGRRKTPHLFDRTRAFTKVAPRAQGRTTGTSVLIAWRVPDEADEAPKIANPELGRSYVGRWSTAANRDPILATCAVSPGFPDVRLRT